MARYCVVSSLVAALLLALTMGGALLLGRGLPEPDVIADLRLRECAAPCWIGIVPGQTSTADGFARFASAFSMPLLEVPASAGGLETVHFFEDGHPAFISLDYADKTIRYISLRVGTFTPTVHSVVSLGEVMRVYGVPTCVTPIARGVPGWLFVYLLDQGALGIEVPGGQWVNLHSPVYALLYRIPFETQGRADCSALARDYRPWRGLAPRWRYKS